jgi:hypothetical protein
MHIDPAAIAKMNSEELAAWITTTLSQFGVERLDEAVTTILTPFGVPDHEIQECKGTLLSLFLFFLFFPHSSSTSFN